VQEVEVKPVDLERLASVVSPERAQRVRLNAARAQASFGDRVIWHVNSTARGGGVAEMLQTLLAYGIGVHIENRWLVLDGDPDFFDITKRIHNLLHGDPGDGGDLSDAEHDHYRRVLSGNLLEMMSRVAVRDIVVLHDPQTAGLAGGLRDAGIRVVWRCHVGRDTPNERTERAWGFLRPYIEDADAFVFSRRQYAPGWIDADRLVVIPPSIDPFSAKNRDLTPPMVSSILATAGLVSGSAAGGPIVFERRDGSEGVVRHRDAGDLVDEPAPRDARLVVQVSRWDRLKDMKGVMTGFARIAADGLGDVHLMLVGPDVSGVTDDPEGAAVFTECREQWRSLPAPIRRRVHIAVVSLDDVDENAIIVNALQRYAYSVVQKSLVEGFGLTVTEAMWKRRAVIASRVGGIQDQITDGRDGLLLEDPYDLGAFAATLRGLLEDPELALRLGSAAHTRVQDEFLDDRHLSQYVDLFARLAATEPDRRIRAPIAHDP
jgi:trehalose synthase